MEGFRDAIFKGCTRPAMFFGVPMLSFLFVTGAFLLAGVWLMYFTSPLVTLYLIAVYVPVILTLKAITKKDDQRLRQMMMRARMRHRHRAGRRIWQTITFSPLAYKKRKTP